jgi:hypothetical protein
VSAGQRLTELVQRLEATDLPANRKQPLRVTLEAACHSFASQNLRAGLNQLGAFQNKLRAQVAPDDPALAEELSRAAQEVIEQATGDLE